MELNESQVELASKLTALQRKLVINLVGSNMSQREAYIAAGGKAKSPAVQDSSACEILSNPKVKAFYNSLINQAASSAVMTREEALERLSQTARVTIADVCEFKTVQVGETPEGDPVYQTVWTIKNSEDIPAEIAVCIKSVSITQQGPKLELHDQNSAIKQLSDMQGWNAPKKSELTGAGGAPLKVEADVSAPEVASALETLLGAL